MMLYTLVLLLLLTLHMVSSDVIDDFRRICPYTDLCTSKGRQSNITDLPRFTPCCMDCYCDADCWKYNDCCIDAQQELDPNPQQTQCASLIVKNNAYHRLQEARPYAKKRFPSYRMISRCPNNYTGSQLIKDKCMEAFTGVPDFDDVVMVSNKDHHDEIYKNKYCASCNGVMDVIKWQLHASYFEDDISIGSSMMASDAVKAIWDQFVFYSSPPETIEFSRPLLDCGDYLTSTCQITQEGNGEQWKHLCEEGFYTPVYLVRPFRVGVFKNPFCLLCNDAVDVYRDVCDASAIDNTRRTDYYGRFTMLFDTTPDDYQLETPSLDEGETRCNEDEIFDHVSNRCRYLYCPFNYAVFFGQCLKLSESVTNALVTLKLLFRPVSLTYNTGTIEIDDPKKQFSFARRMKEVLQFSTCDATHLSVYVYVQQYNDAISFVTLDLELTVSNECSLDYITSNSRRLASEWIRIELPIDHQRLRLLGRVNLADLFNENNPDPDLNGYYRKVLVALRYPKQNPFRIQQLFFCPSIMLNITEYNQLIVKIDKKECPVSEMRQTSLVKLGFFALANRQIAVCTDTYFGFFTSGASSTKTYSRIAFNYSGILLIMMSRDIAWK